MMTEEIKDDLSNYHFKTELSPWQAEYRKLWLEAQEKDMDIRLIKVRGGSKYALVPKEIEENK